METDLSMDTKQQDIAKRNLSTGAILVVRDLVKTFRQGASDAMVLHGVSLRIMPGETVAIVGPSGSGKSTLLNLIAGLDAPTSGEIVVAGQSLAGLGDRAMTAIRRWDMGMVFQRHHLLPQCTVWENVLLPVLAAGSADAAVLDRARTLLERVSLGRRLDAMPGTLSGGERQRVAVVRALIHRPGLLLADEPTGSLDAQTAEGVADVLLDLQRDEGAAMIVVTHSRSLASMMQRVFVLRDGVLTDDTKPEDGVMAST